MTCILKLGSILWIAALGFLVNAPARADVTFFDGTFDLSDYTLSTWQSGGGTIDVTQNLTAGNSGAALQIVTSTPNTGSTAGFFSSDGLTNNTFRYDPGAQGAIHAVSFSIDSKKAAFGVPFLYYWLATSQIYQNGNVYLYEKQISVDQNVWITGGQTGLQAADYQQLDRNSGTLITASHPSFTAGVMLFGFGTGWDVYGSDNIPPTTFIALFDNFSVAVTSQVPGPSTYSMLLGGMVLMGFTTRRRRISATNC